MIYYRVECMALPLQVLLLALLQEKHDKLVEYHAERKRLVGLIGARKKALLKEQSTKAG